ncbi:MAG: hypothetical protein R3E94_09055 [Burkholderiaceae bacterium]
MDAQRQVLSSRQFNPLDQAIGMRLAYWAYEHKDIAEAEKVAKYPDSWRHALPGVHLPADWPAARQDPAGRLLPGSPEGWNTQHNAAGELENQFKVSVNTKTHQITIDFKGSDAWSNWKSDLGNAGASEFAKIQAKAQAAFEALRKDERYQGYQFAATGHSLGGGMAQSFGLKNNIDVYAYNSLPIARETINGDYYKDVGGYEAAIDRYRASGRQVHDVRTPNDIATYHYEGVWQNQYLSHRMGQAPTVLPGPAMPVFLKTALLLSGQGTLVAGAIMGKDHASQALFEAQAGLSVNGQGRYRIPEGHVDFSRVPPEARRLFARLGQSPVVKAICTAASDDSLPYDRFQISHEDGSREHIAIHTRSGEVEIDHYDRDGRRTLIGMNSQRATPARVTEFDVKGRPLGTQSVAMRETSSPALSPALSLALSPAMQTQYATAYAQAGQALQRQGLSPAQIRQVCAAAVSHCARVDLGDPRQFLVSRNGQRLGVMHESGRLSEMPIASALTQSAALHLADAVRAPVAEPMRDVELRVHARA